MLGRSWCWCRKEFVGSLHVVMCMYDSGIGIIDEDGECVGVVGLGEEFRTVIAYVLSAHLG